MAFIMIEFIIYILILLYQSSWIKYLGVLICFVHALFHRKGYHVLGFVLIADYFLLWSKQWMIGIVLFIFIQCLYRQYLSRNVLFYIPLILLCYPHLYTIVLCYACLSLLNIKDAIIQKHWIMWTCLLLALCDFFIFIQYITHQDNPLIWLFYLPSQIYYTKMVSSKEMKPLHRNRYE